MGDCIADGKYASKAAKAQKNLKGFMNRMLSYFERCSKRNGGGIDGDLLAHQLFVQ